jgi:hypothetical protein
MSSSFVFNNLRKEVVVHFVDICGIVDEPGVTGKVINSCSTSGWHIKRVYNATLYMLESTAS